jgi:hypothetical protein
MARRRSLGEAAFDLQDEVRSRLARSELTLGARGTRGQDARLMRPPLVVLGLGSLVLAAAHCGGPSAERSMPASWVGSDRAKLALYMGYVDHEENVPAGVRHDAVRDEAVLMKSAEGETCFRIVERTAEDDDEPLEALHPVCDVNGNKAEAVVTKEIVATQEYPYTASTEAISAQGYSPVSGRAFNLSVRGAPETRVFRVIERSGDVCCAGAGRRIELRLKSSRMEFNHASFTQTFTWKVQ